MPTTRSLPTLDRLAMALSGLCVAHCLATAVLLGLMSAAGGVLGNPLFHEMGLGGAAALAALALGRGALAHGRFLPTAIGSLGLGAMGGALTLPHGGGETIGTVIGVTLLATAHLLNSRRAIEAGLV